MQPAENLAEVKSSRYCTLVQEREAEGLSRDEGLGFLGSRVAYLVISNKASRYCPSHSILNPLERGKGTNESRR